MYFDTIIAGFGGQGVLFMGNCLAVAGMEAGLQVTYMPVYGVEMRGGTANCTVVVSDERIGSPVIQEPVSAVVMNRPSAEKFAPRVSKKGLVLVNSSLVQAKHVPARTKRLIMVPSLDLAQEVGNTRLANMIMLGALAEASGSMNVGQVTKSLPNALAKRYHKMIPVNTEALARGARFIAEEA